MNDGNWGRGALNMVAARNLDYSLKKGKKKFEKNKYTTGVVNSRFPTRRAI